MTLLVVFVLLCLGLVTSQPVSIQIADRAIGGFHATKIAVNPFSPNNTFVVDQYRWVRPIGVNATLSPTDKTAFFNVSVGWKIEGLVVGNDVFWITQSSDWGRKCIALVDSNTKQTINNQTIQNLNYPFVDLPLIASPTSNSNFMKDKVTMFALGVGADTPYFWSIDKSETVFTWEQLIYFYKTQYTAFCATYDVGVVIQSQGLGATPHLHVSDTAGLGWDGALSSLNISNSWIYDIAAVHTGPTSMVVYMLPMNSTTVLCWNITDYYDGLKPGSQCDSFDIPQHNKADIEILNSTHVIVADISYQGAFMYNIATHNFAGWILPDQPTLNQPSTIRVNDDFIYVSQHPCAVKINATTGGLAFNYSQSLSSMHQLVAGLAVDDDSETVFISYQTDSAYMLDVYDFNDVLLRSMKVSSAGALVYSSVLGVIWVASADAATPSVIALDPLNGGVISFVNFTISNQIIVDFKQITFSSFAVVDSVKKEIIITDSQGVILQQVVLDTLKPSTFDVDLQLDTLYVVINNQTASQPNSMLVAVDISSSQITKQLQVAEGFHDTYLFQGVAVRASDGDVFATYLGEDVIFQWNSST